MSALAGFVDFSRQLIAGDPCRAMLAAQRIYGSGTRRIRNEGAVEFGVDLRPVLPEDELDQQPLLVGDTWLIADLRLDNRHELIRDLALDGSRGSALADSAILALAWQKWSRDCIERLVGDFAIAAYSKRTRELILARDTTGQKALHFARLGATVGLASMPTGILALPDYWRGFNDDSLARALLDMPCCRDESGFAGVQRVPAGEIVTITAHGESRRCTWEPDFKALRFNSDADYIEAYREVLDLAVQSRMRRLGPVIASHLSSGFDSSAVASTAARLLRPGERLVAVTAAPPEDFSVEPPRGRMADESGLAARTAAMHRMEHVVVRESEPLAERIRAQARFYQDPYRNLINAGWLKALEQSASGYGAGVLLCADLGNLTLNAGSLRTLGDIFVHHGLRSWWREARLTAEDGQARWTGIMFNSFGYRLPRPLQQMLIKRFQGVHPKRSLSLLNPDRAARHTTAPYLQYGSRTGDSYRERWGYLRTLDYGNIRKGSLAETGVDTRDPMADLRIMKFSTALPREQLLRSGVSRPLAKTALADRVPADVLGSRLRGYQSADWARLIDKAALRELVEEISASSLVRDIVDVPRLTRVVDQWSDKQEQNFVNYELFAGHVPQAIAVGLFIREYER